MSSVWFVRKRFVFSDEVHHLRSLRFMTSRIELRSCVTCCWWFFAAPKWHTIVNIIFAWRKRREITLYSLNCKPLHLTDKVFSTDTNHGLHKIINALRIEGDALKWKVCGPACCIENSLDTGTSFEVIQLVHRFISVNASNGYRIMANHTSFSMAFSVWVASLIFERAETRLPVALLSLNSRKSSTSCAFSSVESLLYSSLYAATRSGKIFLLEAPSPLPAV